MEDGESESESESEPKMFSGLDILGGGGGRELMGRGEVVGREGWVEGLGGGCGEREGRFKYGGGVGC